MIIYNNQNIIPVGTVMNTTVTSSSQQVYLTYSYAIQAVWTGTPTGFFKLQASADPATKAVLSQNISSGANAPVNWSDLSDSFYSVTAAGDFIWNVQDIGYNWVRLVYEDQSSGVSTATITVSTFNSKAP